LTKWCSANETSAEHGRGEEEALAFKIIMRKEIEGKSRK
jgi:hypothetical protein